MDRQSPRAVVRTGLVAFTLFVAVVGYQVVLEHFGITLRNPYALAGLLVFLGAVFGAPAGKPIIGAMGGAVVWLVLLLAFAVIGV